MELKLSCFEFLFRTIPEGLLFILAIYIFSGVKFEVKRFLVSGFVLAIVTFLVRMLPISYGIHTMLNIIIFFIIIDFIISSNKSLNNFIFAFCFSTNKSIF